MRCPIHPRGQQDQRPDQNRQRQKHQRPAEFVEKHAQVKPAQEQSSRPAARRRGEVKSLHPARQNYIGGDAQPRIGMVFGLFVGDNFTNQTPPLRYSEEAVGSRDGSGSSAYLRPGVCGELVRCGSKTWNSLHIRRRVEFLFRGAKFGRAGDARIELLAQQPHGRRRRDRFALLR